METTRGNSLDAAGLLTSEEKQALQAGELPAPTQSPAQRKRKGLSPRLLAALIVGALLTLGVALGSRVTACMRHHGANHDTTFSQLLHSANPESLRKLLHDSLPEKYGKGMFPSEEDAVEAVRDDDAPLATKIVKLAARQDNNSTSNEATTTTEEETTTTEEPTETTTSDDDNDNETTTSEDKPTTTSDDSGDSETSPTPDPSDDDNDDDQGTSVSDNSSTSGPDKTRNSSSSTTPSSSHSSSSEDQGTWWAPATT